MLEATRTFSPLYATRSWLTSWKIKNRAAIFLDRDGVLLKVEKGKYVLSPSDIEWIDGSCFAMTRLAKLDADIIVVSNQQCVGKGLLTMNGLDIISSSINADCEFAISQFYYCTHLESDNCHCRKPQIGLISTAMRERGIDPRLSVMVGDTTSDMLAARIAGIYPIFVSSGLQSDFRGVPSFDNLAEATPFIEMWFADRLRE